VLSTIEVKAAYKEYEENESRLNVENTVLPSSKLLTPFHYLKIVANSIKEGAAISSNMYIPKAIWTQDCKEITSIAKKHQIFKIVSEIIQRYASAIQKSAITIGVPLTPHIAT